MSFWAITIDIDGFFSDFPMSFKSMGVFLEEIPGVTKNEPSRAEVDPQQCRATPRAAGARAGGFFSREDHGKSSKVVLKSREVSKG